MCYNVGRCHGRVIMTPVDRQSLGKMRLDTTIEISQASIDVVLGGLIKNRKNISSDPIRSCIGINIVFSSF